MRPFLRGVLACSALLFFASNFALSIAPAHPYVKGSARPGYFSKISRASEAGVEGIGEIAIADAPPRFVDPPMESAPHVACKVPLGKVPKLLRYYYFRPPPLY